MKWSDRGVTASTGTASTGTASTGKDKAELAIVQSL